MTGQPALSQCLRMPRSGTEKTLKNQRRKKAPTSKLINLGLWFSAKIDCRSKRLSHLLTRYGKGRVS